MTNNEQKNQNYCPLFYEMKKELDNERAKLYHAGRGDEWPAKFSEIKKKYHKKYIASPYFEKVRQAVLERDHHKCVFSGKTENLQVHHTSYRNLMHGDQSEINDCITVNSAAHIAIHRCKSLMHWFSLDNPRNDSELRPVTCRGVNFLVSNDGMRIYDADTLKKYNVSKFHSHPGVGSEDTTWYWHLTVGGQTFMAHRLVAMAWVENPDPEHKTQINHLDENGLNNWYENLEWCTPQENLTYGTKLERGIETKRKNKKKE